MKKTILGVFIFFFSTIFIISSCKENEDNNNNGTAWNVTAIIDLGGSFTVIATANISVGGSGFTAVISTSQIGGAAEIANFSINGSVSGNTYTVTNSTFTIPSGGGTEQITITTGTHVLNGNNISGSGSISVIPNGLTTPILGTYTFTGTR